VLVPVLIFVVCVVAGAVGGTRWLPDLAAGPVGGLAFFVVSGLLGAGLGLVGLHVYSIVEELNNLGDFAGARKSEIIAAGLQSMLWEAGSIFGIGAAVYLLGPAAPVAEDVPTDAI